MHFFGGQHQQKNMTVRESASSYRYALLGLLGRVAISFPRNLPSPLLLLIEAEFHISHAESSLMMSSYLFPYAIVQIPSGSLSDRFGNRFFLLLSMLGTSFGSLLIGFTSSFEQALAVRIVAGLFSGFWFVSSTNFIIQHTQSKMQARASATIGPPIFGFAIDVAGFSSFFNLALTFYIVSLVSILLIREKH